MKLVFCGTPQFAVPTLERLASAGFAVDLVVTQPDRPRGRGLELAHSPVKQSALKLGLPVLQPETIKNNPEFRTRLEELRPQAIIVVGYGRIIPPWMLALPPLGNINLHASLLPKYRGAAPIQWAIARGENITGNTTMRIDDGLDTGDILLQEEIPILPGDTAVTLATRLAVSGAELVVKTLHGLQDGSITPVPQDNSKAKLAPILSKADGRIDFTWPALEICNRLRGFQPWPGAYTSFRGKLLAITSANPAEDGVKLSPGELQYESERLFVGCGGGSLLELLELQPEGKKRMAARDFAHGHRPAADEKLGDVAAPEAK